MASSERTGTPSEGRRQDRAFHTTTTRAVEPENSFPAWMNLIYLGLGLYALWRILGMFWGA